MFYVLFNYKKGQKERDFREFRADDDVIKFLHEKHKEIEVYRIIETARSYRLGLVVTDDIIKSILEPEKLDEKKTKEEKEEEIINQNKEALKRADDALEAGKKSLEKTKEKPFKFQFKPRKKPVKPLSKEQTRMKKEDWPMCPDCNRRKIAPWNRAGRCSHCQQYKKIPKEK